MDEPFCSALGRLPALRPTLFLSEADWAAVHARDMYYESVLAKAAVPCFVGRRGLRLLGGNGLRRDAAEARRLLRAAAKDGWRLDTTSPSEAIRMAPDLAKPPGGRAPVILDEQNKRIANAWIGTHAERATWFYRRGGYRLLGKDGRSARLFSKAQICESFWGYKERRHEPGHKLLDCSRRLGCGRWWSFFELWVIMTSIHSSKDENATLLFDIDCPVGLLFLLDLNFGRLAPQPSDVLLVRPYLVATDGRATHSEVVVHSDLIATVGGDALLRDPRGCTETRVKAGRRYCLWNEAKKMVVVDEQQLTIVCGPEGRLVAAGVDGSTVELYELSVVEHSKVAPVNTFVSPTTVTAP
jgi:hypothetical protein